MKNNIKKKVKENKGFTLVEALIAIIILAIVSVVLVQGVSMARKAYSANKIKTEASALANQEIEKIRSMPYSDVGTTGGDPLGILVNYTTSSGYLVEYTISWRDEIVKSTKRIKISVFKVPMKNKLELVTEITPLEEILAAENPTTPSSASTTTTTVTPPSSSSTTTTTVPLYPAPYNLTVDVDKMDGKNRNIEFHWQTPLNPPYGISYYKVYKTEVSTGIVTISSTGDPTTSKRDREFDENDTSQYKYYITAIYSNGTESPKSNEVFTSPNN